MPPLDRAPRVLAGAPGTDRRAFPRPGAAPRWFEPFHVRAPTAARDEMAAQVEAGADALLAPTFLTHRRALLPVGETRRSREWTVAAVRLAREAADAGLERRGGGAAIVVGSLPDPAGSPLITDGRQPAGASDERDEEEQSGVLADAGPDAVLVEARPTLARTLTAAALVVETGVPAWSAAGVDLDGRLPDGEPVEAWIEAVLAAGVAVALVTPVAPAQSAAEPGITAIVERAALATAGPGELGVLLARPVTTPGTDALVEAWLAAGASVVGIADDASPAAVAPLVAARNRVTTERRQRADEVAREEAAWVAAAAWRAPGGRAAWIGPRPASLPDGFAWSHVEDATEVAALPAEVFRFVVAVMPVDAEALGRILERGGIGAVAASSPEAFVVDGGLRVVDVLGADGTRIVVRREG